MLLVVSGRPSVAAEPIEYNRQIRPILAENCFACHGPDSASRKADLRLDRSEAAVKSGAIAPGKPDESEMIRRIFESDPTEVMPPPRTKKTLTAAQKELLKRWVADGAKYQAHWSLIAPQRPELPAVKNAAWIRNPIDRFILAELEKRGLQPAPEADRRTLARRLSLDLTGLPPAPADVEAFVNDASADAYEKLVDKLLQSPHWGEHRGRYWLDAARYGDTHGIHIDNYRENWAYRDWVINAFNRNQPFDQFTREQLAGDLLPNRTLDQQIATGFNRCNITTSEGGAIADEYLVLYDRDRTETTAQTWLGLTAGCAVCHDHKFDPISQREFYSLAAFFNNTTQPAMDGNVKDTPPVVTVPRPEDRARWDALGIETAEVMKQIDARKLAARPEFDKWLAGVKSERIAAAVPHDGLRFHALLNEGSGSRVTLAEDGQLRAVTFEKEPTWSPGPAGDKAFTVKPGSTLESPDTGDFDSNQPFSCAVWFRYSKKFRSGPIVARMDETNGYRGWDLWLENGKVGTHVVHQWQDDALKVLTKADLKPDQWHHVALTYDGSAKATGVKLFVDGVAQETTVLADKLRNTIRTDKPFQVGQRFDKTRLDDAMVQDVRVYGRALTADQVRHVARDPRAAALAAKPAGKRTAADRAVLFDWWLEEHDPASRDLARHRTALEEESAAIKARGTIAHVMNERPEPPAAFVLFRGDYDKRRDRVEPNVPAALPPLPAELPHNRLGLAEWLLRPEHPLTARVTVNRFWQEVFGTGLVRTTGDFGVTGEPPSHPELLDWLAVEFRESGWDVKRFFKLLVMSAAYRQAAVTTPEKLEKDAANRYLSRGPRFRMDAEMIRDYALAASGLLVSKIGGPSVRPYQPEGVWEAVAMKESDTRFYKPDTGEGLYRRSLYTFWKRAAPPAAMDLFNAPSREVCTVRRERTNTPLQALATMNDVQLVEAARHLGQLALKECGGDNDAGLTFLAQRLLARPLRSEERPVVRATLDVLLSHYRAHADDAKKLIAVGESKADPALDPATLAAWTMLTNQMMNLDEVLNK